MQNVPPSPAGRVFSLFLGPQQSLPLRAGEIVSAEVIAVGEGSAVTVRVGNVNLKVQTDIALRKGGVLSLRVEKEENVIYLRLTGAGGEQQPEAAKNALLSALNGYEKIKPSSEAMMRLVEVLAKLPDTVKANLPEIDIVNRFLLRIDDLSGRTIKDVVDNGGIFFEAKLRILALGLEADGVAADIEAGRIIAGDLKASLLRLKDTFLSPAVLEHARSRVAAGELLDALNTVLRNIEFYQLQSKLTDSLQFFLPLVWEQLRDGEVIVREYDYGKPGERSYACFVNLDLERAGKVGVHLVYQGGYVHVACAAENGTFARLLQDGAGMLEQRFKESGLRLGHLALHQQQKVDFGRTHAEAGISITV